VLAVQEHLAKALLGVHHKQAKSHTLVGVEAVLLLLVLQRLGVMRQRVMAVLELHLLLADHL
jgi:hypothetical protein